MKNLNEKIIGRQTALANELLETLVPQVLEAGHPADRVLARFFKSRRELGGRDRRFLSECFFSYFRWLGWTRALGLAPLEAAAVSWLLDQTAIHPALAAAAGNGEPLGGRTLDEKLAALARRFPDAPPLTQSGLLPPAFADHLALPSGCENRFYEALQQRPPTWLRLRNAEFKKTLTDAAISFKEHAKMPDAIAIEGGISLGALGHGGQYEVQDIASQAVGLIAAPAPGSDWWDACAGAGGKALHLADLMNRQGKILATDVRPEALRECKKRARTDGIAIIRTQFHDLAQDPPFSKQFDGVLVDAPCSGRGTWSRNPDARWRSDPGDPAQKRNLQIRMLNNAAPCVKPGGLLIYAVCTFTQEETAEGLERFLSAHPEFAPQPFAHPLTGETTDGRLQLWPWDGPGDGMFIARLRKKP